MNCPLIAHNIFFMKKMSIYESSFVGSLNTKNLLQYITLSYEILECLEEYNTERKNKPTIQTKQWHEVFIDSFGDISSWFIALTSQYPIPRS